MSSQHTEPPPRRRIEIVPLGEPVHDARPTLPSGAAPWQPPAVRTSQHPPVAHLAPAAPQPPAMPLAPTPDRVRAVLDRERARLHDAAALPPPAAAPFPLPGRPALETTSAAGVPRRVPKQPPPDTPTTALSAEVAAAIARVTAPELPDVSPPTARRIVIVPLGDAPASTPPEPAATVVALPPPPPPPPAAASPAEPAPVIDLRDKHRRKSRDQVAHPCPVCAAPGTVVVIDAVARTTQLSCRTCFRQWTEANPEVQPAP